MANRSAPSTFDGIDFGLIQSSASAAAVDRCAALLFAPDDAMLDADPAAAGSAEREILRLLGNAWASTAIASSEGLDDLLIHLVPDAEVRKALCSLFEKMLTVMTARERLGVPGPAAISNEGAGISVRWRLSHALGERNVMRPVEVAGGAEAGAAEAPPAATVCHQRSIPLISFTIKTAEGQLVTFSCTPDEASALSANLHAALRAPQRLV